MKLLMRKRLGLIVNPIAGMGGKVGLKGTDGYQVLSRALSLGAQPESPQRTIEALKAMSSLIDEIEMITGTGDMGENQARVCGFDPIPIGTIDSSKTTAQDTERIAKKMCEFGVDLLLFAGGDGTARNIQKIVKNKLIVLGIPAGVKIHSAVFATTPRTAGVLALQYMSGNKVGIREAEVMDIDEDAFREQRVVSSLYGYLRVPYIKRMVQNVKAGQTRTEDDDLQSIAQGVVSKMAQDFIYIIGPGTTTRAVMQCLGLKNTLIGVDVVKNGKLVASDVNEDQLLNIIEGNRFKIVVTVIGGQGYLFGRGNQQISHQIIKKAGKENIVVIAGLSKLLALEARALFVDTGDVDTNRMLNGYIKVRTGFKEKTIFRVDAG